MTPIEALQHDPQAQLAERHRQETPWLDHEQLRPGDLISLEEWDQRSCKWHTSYSGLLVSWHRIPSNQASEFEVLEHGGLNVLRVYDSDDKEVRVCLVLRRQLS